MKFTLIHKDRFPRALSQAIASNHPNVFTSTLSLLEGPASEAWEPFNKLVFFLFCKINCPSILP
jgi:hypothetical protein